RATSGPPVLFGHAMAYDSSRGVTVLFGGYLGASVLSGQTWEWDGSTWTQRVVSGPPGLMYPAMAYDSARGVTVLFGGYTSSPLFRRHLGVDWDRLDPAGSERTRGADLPMANDSARGVTVLFGGEAENGPYFCGDTWEWNGTSWTLRAIDGPSPRREHAMVYDAARGVT